MAIQSISNLQKDTDSIYFFHGFNRTEYENEDPLVDLTPENYLESAANAIAIGKALGDSVIIMATSTGGTLALTLAARSP